MIQRWSLNIQGENIPDAFLSQVTLVCYVTGALPASVPAPNWGGGDGMKLGFPETGLAVGSDNAGANTELPVVMAAKGS